MALSANLALMVNGNNRTLAAPSIPGALVGEGEVLFVAFVAAGLFRVRLHDLSLSLRFNRSRSGTALGGGGVSGGGGAGAASQAAFFKTG